MVNIIKKTLVELFNLPKIHKGKLYIKERKTGLIFPEYLNERSTQFGKTRYSEQECRFLFAKNIENDVIYSIETPTKYAYRFSKVGTGEKIEPKVVMDGGKSAQIDLSIHDNDGKIKCAIEFKKSGKSRNKKESSIPYEIIKDLLKLSFEGKEDSKNYFIHVIENFDEETLNIAKKNYKKAFAMVDKQTGADTKRVIIVVGGFTYEQEPVIKIFNFDEEISEKS
jgi:hypothetical protein